MNQQNDLTVGRASALTLSGGARSSSNTVPSTHTPGPWTVKRADADFRAPDSGDFALVSPDLICPAIVWGGHAGGEANAARIVACVNACEGYDNDVLARNPMRDLWLSRSQIGNDVEALRERNAALVEALRELIPDAEENVKAAGGCDHSVGICMCPEIRRIEAAHAAIRAASAPEARSTGTPSASATKDHDQGSDK
jgi:hypothetical protein